ncbi:hypothetical protein F5Y08DRAFT_212870 [Xylaria arbuscula]|nr:hypothetical protein F5Y08DRAFT_212870 [Xylaria arbuscula]
MQESTTTTTAATFTSDNKVDDLGHRKILILYGSETGNSEESAGDIERLARRLHFHTALEEMNDVNLSDLLQYPLVIFVIATTGQGDLPKNARSFWKSLLRKRLLPGCLHQVHFTTFGLGDSSYFQYNWAARKLHKRLQQLGAVECLPRGEADERHEEGIDGTFLPWCLTLEKYLEKAFPLPPGLSPIPLDVQLTPKFTIRLVEQDGSTDIGNKEMANPRFNIDNHGRSLDREAAIYSHEDNQSRLAELKYELEVENRTPDQYITARVNNFTAATWPGGVDTLDRPNVLRDVPAKYSLDDSASRPERTPPDELLPIPGSRSAVVTRNSRLTPSTHWQDVRQLSIQVFDDESTTIPYKAGDIAIIYPKNFPRDVQVLVDLMGWGDIADKVFEHIAHGDDIPRQTPRNCYPLENSTLRELLIHNYDITCIPRRSFFTQIAHYTEDPTHRERLREFANPGLSDEFYDYTSRPRRSILEVLQDFPSVQIPYQHIPSVFPVIRGREYSIASGGDLLQYDGLSPGTYMVELAIALVKYKTVLRKTRQGLCSRYIASLRPGTRLNIAIHSNNIPEIILDPSKPLLAIAPGTGVAPIRAILHERANAERYRIEDVRREDALFYGGRNRAADFLFAKDWQTLGATVFTAFSRDQPSKIYVQDIILRESAYICQLLRKNCVICLCGSSGKMPEAVRNALYDCMVKEGLAANREEAKSSLHKNWLFWEEVW